MLHAGVHTKTCTTRCPTRGLAENDGKTRKVLLLGKTTAAARFLSHRALPALGLARASQFVMSNIKELLPAGAREETAHAGHQITSLDYLAASYEETTGTSPSHRAAIKLTGGDEKNKSEHERPQHDNRKKNRLPEQGKAHNNDSCCREEKKHQTSRSRAGLALGKIKDESRTISTTRFSTRETSPTRGPTTKSCPRGTLRRTSCPTRGPTTRSCTHEAK